MKKKPTVQYTVRDVPEEIDGLLRERAATEGVSLNLATLNALQRGLGTERVPVRYRTLRQMLAQKPKVATATWRAVLEEQDKINPEDWK
jgi:plasmid stability protein